MSIFKVGDIVYYNTTHRKGNSVAGIVSVVWNEENSEKPSCFVTLFEPVAKSEIMLEDEPGVELLGTYAFENELTLCEGMTNKNFCEVWCEDKSRCSDLREIVLCPISDFSQLRHEGKYNPEVCKQRNCKHFDECQDSKWL